MVFKLFFMVKSQMFTCWSPVCSWSNLTSPLVVRHYFSLMVNQVKSQFIHHQILRVSGYTSTFHDHPWGKIYKKKHQESYKARQQKTPKEMWKTMVKTPGVLRKTDLQMVKSTTPNSSAAAACCLPPCSRRFTALPSTASTSKSCRSWSKKPSRNAEFSDFRDMFMGTNADFMGFRWI